MKTIQIMGPGKVEIIEIPVPEIKENEVLVKVKTCVTCPHWDITLFKGVDIFERPGYPKYPVTPGYPGHEMSGDVVSVGSNVKKLKVGDRVATLVTAGEERLGFYCEYINRPEDSVVKIPGNISYEAAASMEMAYNVSPYISQLGDIYGLRVGIVGMGPAGLIALQMVKALGAKEVIAIDVLKERLELAKKLGATRTVNSLEEDDIAFLQKNSLDGCVDCSGAASGCQIALDYTLGPVSIFGVVHGDAKFNTKHWSRGVYLPKRIPPSEIDAKFVVELWEKGELDTEILVGAKLPYEKYADGIKMLIEKKVLKVCFYPTL